MPIPNDIDVPCRIVNAQPDPSATHITYYFEVIEGRYKTERFNGTFAVDELMETYGNDLPTPTTTWIISLRNGKPYFKVNYEPLPN